MEPRLHTGFLAVFAVLIAGGFVPFCADSVVAASETIHLKLRDGTEVTVQHVETREDELVGQLGAIRARFPKENIDRFRVPAVEESLSSANSILESLEAAKYSQLKEFRPRIEGVVRRLRDLESRLKWLASAALDPIPDLEDAVARLDEVIDLSNGAEKAVGELAGWGLSTQATEAAWQERLARMEKLLSEIPFPERQEELRAKIAAIERKRELSRLRAESPFFSLVTSLPSSGPDHPTFARLDELAKSIDDPDLQNEAAALLDRMKMRLPPPPTQEQAAPASEGAVVEGDPHSELGSAVWGALRAVNPIYLTGGIAVVVLAVLLMKILRSGSHGAPARIDEREKRPEPRVDSEAAPLPHTRQHLPDETSEAEIPAVVEESVDMASLFDDPPEVDLSNALDEETVGPATTADLSIDPYDDSSPEFGSMEESPTLNSDAKSGFDPEAMFGLGETVEPGEPAQETPPIEPAFEIEDDLDRVLGFSTDANDSASSLDAPDEGEEAPLETGAEDRTERGATEDLFDALERTIEARLGAEKSHDGDSVSPSTPSPPASDLEEPIVSLGGVLGLEPDIDRYLEPPPPEDASPGEEVGRDPDSDPNPLEPELDLPESKQPIKPSIPEDADFKIQIGSGHLPESGFDSFPSLDPPPASSPPDDSNEVAEFEEKASDESTLEEETEVICPQTGLFTREFFDRQFPKAFERSRRDRDPLTLVLLRIEEGGEDASGECGTVDEKSLQKAADALRKSVRTRDILARFDERTFAVLMLQVKPTSAFPLAMKIRTDLKRIQPVDSDAEAPESKVSFGMNCLSDADRTSSPEELLAGCLDALELASMRGGNQIVLHGVEGESRV